MLCDSCAPGYWGKPKEACIQCPAGEEDLGVGNRIMWCLIINLGAFGVGAVFVLVLFKSHMVDQAINFLYRVRTNPILALSQVRGADLLTLLTLTVLTY